MYLLWTDVDPALDICLVRKHVNLLIHAQRDLVLIDVGGQV